MNQDVRESYRAATIPAGPWAANHALWQSLPCKRRSAAGRGSTRLPRPRSCT
jgi:hypothetical protein